MFKNNKLMHKILAIIGVNLLVGITIVGCLAIWLQYNSSMKLQENNSRTMSAVIIDEISAFMMKDDLKSVKNLAKAAKEQNFGFDIQIFDREGKDSVTGAVNKDLAQSLSTGKRFEKRETTDGIHTLRAAVPMLNEERCKQCHDAGNKYLGAVQLRRRLSKRDQDDRHPGRGRVPVLRRHDGVPVTTTSPSSRVISSSPFALTTTAMFPATTCATRSRLSATRSWTRSTTGPSGSSTTRPD